MRPPGAVLVEEAGGTIGDDRASGAREGLDRPRLLRRDGQREREDEHLEARGIERAALDLLRRDEIEGQTEVGEAAHPAVAVRGEAGIVVVVLLPPVVEAEDARRVHRGHRVVHGDAVAHALRLHQELADPLEAEGLEGRAHVAARARPGEVGVHDGVAPEEVGKEHALQGRAPDLVAHPDAAAPVARPEAHAGPRLGERAMHVPLVAAVVGQEVVDDAVEPGPVGPVPGRRDLGARERDAPFGVALHHRVAHHLVGVREGRLHVGAVVGPGREDARLSGLVGGRGPHRVPVREGRVPRAVQRLRASRTASSATSGSGPGCGARSRSPRDRRTR